MQVYSAELEARKSPQRCSAGTTSSIAKSIPSEKRSSNIGSRTPSVTGTSQRPISHPGRARLTSSPEDSPASLFPTQGNGEEETTTVISGRKCSGLLTKSGPLGSLVKTLLGSPQWSKEGFSLTWEAVPLYSRKVTEFTDTPSTNPSPLNASAETLRVRDIPSNRCLFRLRLSELPTAGTGSSSLLMQTPTAVMTCEPPEKMRERAEKNGYKNGTRYGSLESQVMYDPKVAKLLPTPQAMDGTEIRSKMGKNDILMETPSGLRRVVQTGSDFGVSLGFMANNNLLPTPTARDFKNPSTPEGERITRKKEQGYTIELNDLAAMKILPTPSARDWKGKTNPGIVKEGSGCIYGETLPDTIGRIAEDSSRQTDGGTFRLSPLFTEEMMGFPSGWTTYPFLNPNGGPSPSRPTETQ